MVLPKGKETQDMEITINGTERKEIVRVLSEHFGKKAIYAGPPTFAYKIGAITVDRNGTVIFEDESLKDEMKTVLFGNEMTEEAQESADENEQDESIRLTIRIPIGDMTPQGLVNLMNMLHSKQYLINRSIGENGFSISDSLTETLNTQSFENTKEVVDYIIEHGGCDGVAFLEENIIFSGFRYPLEDERYQPYMELAAAMVKKASEQKRVHPKATVEQNEKYYMRAWLVNLGFGGKEGKEVRNFFLKNLKGHTAFRTPADADKWKANRKAEKEKKQCSD
jgi:hypothetical protein